MTRYAPSRPFPAYAFVPGHWPHPRHPGGHSHGVPESEKTLLDPQAWRSCEAYLYGIDLWNHGYYWEAHEAWEGLWREAEPAHLKAFLQGLIRLAAAGVKARQGMADNVRSHAEAAVQRFTLAQAAPGQRLLCGLDLDTLVHFARHVAEKPPTAPIDPVVPVRIVFRKALVLAR